ncbi:hypothetical protein A9Q87_01455 [Flavobacteriales bacterium 34_180_T64]|nr:hypothetical protein A9Q87_01455 [Flavobacteriales bacterium 34_180_T64]
MKKIVKEPLFHFLLIGAIIFLVYMMVNTEQNTQEIVIDDNLVNELASKWELKRNRRPTLEEMEGMINQYVEQEVLYQEALTMNLDHNDEIVKRRLAQKMEFISDNMAESLQPTLEMLESYYEEHKDNYAKAPIYSMQVLYFSEDKRENASADALAALNHENPLELGDNISLPSNYKDESAFKITRDYGRVFTNALDSLETGKWVGPVQSGFGIHLVNILEKKAAGYYEFDDIAEKVSTDYNFDASNDFKQELIATLLKNYSIQIDVEDPSLKKELDEKY